jgi:hypothetical protein
MDTFSNPSDRSFTQYDAAGNVVQKGSMDIIKIASGDADKEEVYDAEAQIIRDGFKRPPY